MLENDYNNQDVNKILYRSAELLEQGWCQGRLAKAEDGTSADATSPYATQWCILGSITRAMEELQYIDDMVPIANNPLFYQVKERILHAIQQRYHLFTSSIARVNDKMIQDQSDAVSLVRSAITEE